VSDIISKFKDMARMASRTIVLPESTEERMLKAAEIIMEKGTAEIILLGDEGEIKSAARSAGADVSKARIIPLEGTAQAKELASKLYELRKHKGMSEEQAVETLKTPMYYAAMLVKEDLAHGYVAGAENTTGNTLKPALQIIKTKPGINVVSSFFLMVHPDNRWGVDGCLFFADCALVPDPDENQLAEIAITTADSFKTMFKMEPLVAMLSFSTKGSASHPGYRKTGERPFARLLGGGHSQCGRDNRDQLSWITNNSLEITVRAAYMSPENVLFMIVLSDLPPFSNQ